VPGNRRNSSISSWAVIVYKARELAKADRQTRGFLEAYQGATIEAANAQARQFRASPLAAIFRAGLREMRGTVEILRAYPVLARFLVAFLGAVGVNQGYGEMGYNILERRWARPSCDVNGLYGGYSGEGAKTIIPSFAGAKVSFRLAAMQDPHRIAELFEHWLRRHDTGGCRWEIALHGIAHPVIVSRDSPYMQAARDAIKHASGQDAALIREGATIPVVADLQRKLGIESLLIGFARHDDAIHSPNEKYDLDNLHLGCRTMAVLLHTLADAKG